MAAGVLTYTQHLMGLWQPSKSSVPPLSWAEMVRSANYNFKCYPPEVAASRLSSGQLMVAAGPTGSCPLYWFLILLSGITVYIRKVLQWQWSPTPTVKHFLRLPPPSLSFHLTEISLFSVSLSNSTFISIPTQPLSPSSQYFSVSFNPFTPSLTSSSGKGLTRPSESSERYIWELITLLWRLPVCRAESETQREEEERVWGRKGFGLYCTPYTTMEKRFHSKSNFWLCYCSPLQIMNQCGSLQPCRPCALGDGLCHNMTVGMQISTMKQCTLTEHSSHVQKQNISQAAVRCRYFNVLPAGTAAELWAHITK